MHAHLHAKPHIFTGAGRHRAIVHHVIHAWEGCLQPAAQQRHPIGAANLAGAAPKGQAAAQRDCGRGAEGGGAEQAGSIQRTERNRAQTPLPAATACAAQERETLRAHKKLCAAPSSALTHGDGLAGQQLAGQALQRLGVAVRHDASV